jgi:AcrR family transcriptional regulator
MTSASIWDFPEHGSRGPRPRHNRAAIAALAVRIADAENLEAVTMRRLAGELGIAVMSLYNYVPAKDHLAQLMADRLAAEYVYPATPPAGPRAAIAELAGQTRDIARRHPWLAALLHRPMPPGPNGLRYLDYFLGLLASSALGTGAKLEVIAMISGFATMYGAMQAAPAGQLASAGEQIQALTRTAAKGRYPNLAAALAVTGEARSHADMFGSCVERLIDLARLGLYQPFAGFQSDCSGGVARAGRERAGRAGRSRSRCHSQTTPWRRGIWPGRRGSMCRWQARPRVRPSRTARRSGVRPGCLW